MVTTTTHHTSSRHLTYPGSGYDGVVHVSFGGYYGTGVLLSGGHAVLTAAHLFDGRSGSTNITFDTRHGPQTFNTTRILQHPGYDTQSNNDLAIVWLPNAAPVEADRYDIYRASDEIGQIFTLAGYGQTGTGNLGTSSTYSSTPLRLKAINRFDADAATLKSILGTGMEWTPLTGTQLIADFDNGMTGNDALGSLIFHSDTGLGLDEGLIAPGDSGGPAFLHGKVAGIASYTASLKRGDIMPDIDNNTNSSFGELAAWQRVSAYQQWIDQSLRASYTDAPTRPEEVMTAVVEGNTGSSLVYFLLQFTGIRSNPDEILSVDYSTRDGTAMAGSDYIAASGRLVLYPNEIQAVIPIEIIGDPNPEPDEQFYLDVFNPIGGSFGEGIARLSAMRTILNDDGWLI